MRSDLNAPSSWEWHVNECAARTSATSDASIGRGVIIGLLGFALAYLQAAEVILSAYGLMFLLALPMLRLGSRALALLSVAFAVLGPVAVVGLTRAGALGADASDPTLTSLVTHPATVLEVLLFTGVYPVVVFLGYLCAGLAIGRLDLSARRLAWLLVGGGVALAVLGQAASALVLLRLGGLTHLVDHLNATSDGAVTPPADPREAGAPPTSTAAPPAAPAAEAEEADAAEDEADEEDMEDEPDAVDGPAAQHAQDDPGQEVGSDDLVTGMDLLWESDGADSWWYLALASPHANTTPDVANTLGSALAVLGVALLVCRLPAAVRMLRPLADLGSMPLTLYTAHLLVLWTGVLEDDPALLYVTMTVGMLGFAVAWRAAFGQGPLERMLGAASGRVRIAIGSGRRGPRVRSRD